MTIGEAVAQGCGILKEHQIDNADYDSFALFEAATQKDRTYYLLHKEEPMQEQVAAAYMAYIKRRANHEPLQHILGKTWFYGYEFLVTPDVLVPRPDTEILVEETKKIATSGDYIIDMCTGSGCILLTLAKEKCLCQGLGIDISKKALAVAKKNQEKLGVSQEQITWLESNLFDNVLTNKKADILVSNPPYIRTDVIATLSEEVRLYDPMAALDGFADGLYFYREITKHAAVYLRPGGYLLYEIGCDQAKEVMRMMQEAGFIHVEVRKDYAGLDRVVKGQLR